MTSAKAFGALGLTEGWLPETEVTAEERGALTVGLVSAEHSCSDGQGFAENKSPPKNESEVYFQKQQFGDQQGNQWIFPNKNTRGVPTIL